MKKKEKPNSMLHGQLEGKMPKEHMAKKEKMGKMAKEDISKKMKKK